MDPMVQGQLKEFVLMAVMVSFFGIAFYTFATALRRRQRNEMQRHMLDKFATAKDFADFVQSPAGQKYVMSFSEEATSPYGAILGSVRTGVVLLFGGAGIAATVQATTKNSYIWGLGIVIACLGFGFLASAAISYWLAKKIAQEDKE